MVLDLGWHALAAPTAVFDLWRRTPVYAEVWCESDSMAGVLIEETERYNVPLMVSRGFSSKTYLYQAGKEISKQGRPAHLYWLGWKVPVPNLGWCDQQAARSHWSGLP